MKTYPLAELAPSSFRKACGFKSILQGQAGGDQYKEIYKKVCKEIIAGATFDVPEYETKNRLTVDAKNKTRTKTESNKSAAEAFKNSIKW